MLSKKENVIIASLAIIFGVLLIALRQNILSIAMTIIGIALMGLGLLDLLAGLTVTGTIKSSIGLLLLVFGWVFVKGTLYIFAILLIFFGITQIIYTKRLNVKGFNVLDTISIYAPHIFDVLIGICLFFNQGATVAWVFIVSGCMFILEGALIFVNTYLTKKINDEIIIGGQK